MSEAIQMTFRKPGLSDVQLLIRRSRIGSSEIAALLGLDPYKSELDVYTEKVCDARPRPADDKIDHRDWGLAIEAPILRHHARKKGYTLIESPEGDEVWPTLVHPTEPLCCTPDAIALPSDAVFDMPAYLRAGVDERWQMLREQVELIALQAKNDQGWGQIEWGDPGTDDAPMTYLSQCTVEQGVLIANGLRIVRDELVVSIKGAPPVGYPVDFDPDLFESLAGTAVEWLEKYVKAGVPPEGTPGDVANYLKRRFTKGDRPMLEATEELVDMWRRVDAARAAKKEADERAEIVENALKAKLGDSGGVLGLCSWKLQKGSTYTVTKEPTRVLRKVGGKK